MTAINKVLIANRGEIARRIMRTCRAMGIQTVAVFSDADAALPFVAAADEAVPLGGLTAADSYLRADAIVDAARRAGASAVHPGYGFLAEDASFARRCIAAGLTWIGPPPAAIESMGSKVAAREIMSAAGVPVLPGADISTLADDKLAAAAEEIGWPLLVKASFGGGGRGMRIVRERAGLLDAVQSARREAASAFGNDAVFLERFVDRPRHIEIQVVGDHHGGVVHLFERECSIQRRYQKIVEEAPSPAVDASLRAALGDAAVAAARAVGYIGAGTVEFILTPDGEFFFLEMNTRLQVEHPVTELVTGLDLVRVQLLVAQRLPLPREVHDATITGHAIEVRLYAEDPDHDYLPAAGRLERFRIPDAAVRVDSGYADGCVVSPHYDSMLAKVIAHGATRGEARQRLAGALRNAQLHGTTTNRSLLIGILEHPDFVGGAIDTGFLERRPPQSFDAGRIGGAELRHAAVSAALALGSLERHRAPVLASIPAGWRNNASQPQRRAFAVPGGAAAPITVGYQLGRNALIEVDGQTLDGVSVRSIAPDNVELLVEGVVLRYAVHIVGDTVYVDGSRGSVTLRELPRFPRAHHGAAEGSLTAPMPGTVVRIEVREGDRVEAGQVLLIMEAMKMEHQIIAPRAGFVAKVAVDVGQAVDADSVLVVVESGEAGEP